MDWMLHPITVQTVGLVVMAAALLFALLQAWRAVLEVGGSRAMLRNRQALLSEQIRASTLGRELAEKRGAGAWSGTRKFRVDRVVDEARDIRSFYLVPHDGKDIPMFHPGQFLTFKLRIPNQPKEVVRCYSLSDSPFERNHYRISVKRLDPPPKAPDAPPGLSSNYLHREIQPGDILDVRAPGGGFYLDMAQHRPVVLIAGGVGITPVYSMLKALIDSNDQREIWFYYGLRNAEEYCYREILESIMAEHGNVNLRICMSDVRDESPEQPFYRLGQRVSVELMKQELPSNNYVFHICGPPPMMAGVTADLEAWGVPTSDIRTEAFGPASVKKTEKPEMAAAAEAGVTFKVEFARSGKTLEWTNADNLLEFAEDNGIMLDSGCRAGGCGTCSTAVKSGKVDYVREPDTQPEEGSCLACVSRPQTDLVLDA